MVVVLGIGRRVGEVIASASHIKSQSVDAQLIRIMSRLMGFIFAMALLLQGGSTWAFRSPRCWPVQGVVGMALALSAQDVLKNVFGSIMLVMDKPFIVGELAMIGIGFAQKGAQLEGAIAGKLTELAMELQREGRLDSEKAAKESSKRVNAILKGLSELYGEYIKTKV